MPAIRNRTRWGVALVLLLLNAAVWAPALAPAPSMTLTMLDVGQGDALVIRTPRGHVLLVDAGPRTPEDDAGRRVVVPFLRAQGINRVDALLLTHPDEDHIGGAETVLEREPVGRLLVSGIPGDSATYARVLEEARARGVPIVRLAHGQSLDFGDGVVGEVLNPSGAGEPTHNNGSLVVRLRYGGTSALLTGDAELGAEEEMERTVGDLHADLLKVGHHGSRTSTSEGFLDAVQPRAALVSVGRHNLFGHPSPVVLDRLAAHHIPVLRTDQDGAITAISDGSAFHITTAVRPRTR